MKQVNMKLPKRSKKEMETGLVGADPGGDRYPYGLTIRLENEALKKLGLKPENFTVGKSVNITAKCDVEGLNSRESQNGEDYMEVSLQITDLAVDVKKSKFNEAKSDDAGDGGVM